MDRAKTLEALGVEAMEQGRHDDAVAHWLEAAPLYVAQGDAASARWLWANLASLFRLSGDHERAVHVAELALAMNVSASESDMAAASLAGVLDLSADPRAAALWRVAAASFERTMPMMAVKCLANAAGAEFARQSPRAMASARLALQKLPPGAPPAFLAGIIGAVGDSAGARGIPFLAQAVWLMARAPTAYNSSTQLYWAKLVGRLGYAAPMSLPLCVLGFGSTFSQPALTNELTPGLVQVLTRCAEARSISQQAMVNEVKANVRLVAGVAAGLERLVPEDLWLLSRP